MEEVKKLYNALIGKGYTSTDLGDEKVFAEKMQDATNRKELYDYVSSRGDFKIGSYDNYEKRLGSTVQPVQPEVSAIEDAPKVEEKPQENLESDLLKPQSTETPSLLNMGAKPKDYFAEAGTKAREAIRQERQPREYQEIMKPYTSSFGSKKEHEFINTIEGYNQATRIFGGEEANRRREELNEQARPWMEAQKTWTPSSARRFREQTMEQTWYDPYAIVPEEYKALATKQWGKEGSEDAYFSAWMNLTPEQREAFIRKEHVKSFFNEETTSKMQGIRERATTYANNALSEIPVSVDPRHSATAMAARTVNNIGVQTTKALDKAEEIKQAYKNHQLDENFFTGAYKGMKDGLTDIDNWTGIYMIGEMTNLYDIADKMEKGVQLSQAEEDFLDAQAYKLAVEAALADDLGWGYKSGNVTGASVPFMLQMLASPIGGASGKAIDKGFAAVGRRAIDKFGKGILKKLLTKAPVKKVAKGLVGTVGKGIGQTILFGSDRVAAGTMQRHLGNEMIAERANEEFNAGVQAKAGEDWGTALFKEGVSASMENISEFAGGAFIDDFTKAVGKTIAKEFLDAIDGPVGRRLANAASKQKANKIFQAIANNKWGQHAVNISKSVQNGMAWDGLINEYLEEVLNNAANVMIGDMSVEDFTSLEKNAETILGLAWTSGFFTANSAVSRVGGYIRGNIALKRTDRAAQQIFTGDMQEKWNAYTQALSQANGYEEVEQLYKGLIADISNNQDKETARAQMTEATAYMTNYVKMMGMNAATEEAEEEEPKTPAQQDVESAQGEGIAAHGTERELDVVEEMDQSYNQLAEHLGGTNVEDWLLQYGETADKQLEAIRGSELDEQTKAMADTYLTSAQRYEGLLLANQEEVDAIVEEAAKEFDANVNQELGSVIQVLTTQDKVAYVIQGNPNEREQITLRYNDGSMEQASSKVVEKVLSESDAQAIRGDMLEGVRKSAIAEIVTRMQGNVPNATQMQMPVGHSVVVDGQAGVVAGVNADGTMQIQMQGGNAVNAAPQQVMDAQAYNDIMERKARAREGVTVSVPVREEAEVPVSEEAATEVVEAIEEMSEAQKLLQEYMDESVSLEDRQAIVENNVAQAKQAAMEAQAEFDAMNESKPNAKDYTNIAEFKQAQEQWKAQMQEKQQLLDIARQQEATWNEVQSGINQPVVAEDISEHTEATPATPQAIEDLQAEAKNHNSKHDIKALAKEIGVSAKRIQRVIDFANQIGVKLNFANVTRTEGDKGAFTNADNMASKREITMSKYMLAKGMAIEWVMGHELTHQIKADGNAAQWETYKQTIINALGQETFDKRVKSQSKVYSMAGAYKNMPANEFMETMEEEVCADAAGDMLLNPDNMNKVMGVPQSLASRIWNGLKNMVTFSTPSKIKQAVDAWQQLAEGKEMIGQTEGKKHSIVGVTGARALDKVEGTTVRMDNMDVAEEMEAAGKDAETIWMATGWERGVDGKWKYDIMDYIPEFVDQTAKKQVYENLIDAKIKEYEAATNPTEKHELRMKIGEYMDKSAEFSQYFVADILGEDHPLIKAYPDLGNITIEFNPNTEDCGYYPVIEQIELGTKNEDAKQNARNLAHELQHAIQHAEGFARGGNISSANVKIEEVKNILGINDKASINDIITYLEHGFETPSQNKALTDLAKNEGYDNAIDYVNSLNPIEYYNRLAGEVESRNASARQDMTPEERRQTRPSKSEDIDRDNQEVRYSVTPEERMEMEARILDWLSEENLTKAAGMTREQIFEEFGNQLEPIAYLPMASVRYLGDNLTDERIYSGKGYFIDHAMRNHAKEGKQTAVEDIDVSKYLNIQNVLDNPDSIKETFVDGKRTVIFIKKIGRYFAELTQVEENGKIVLHKSFFNQKKEPYAKLADIRSISPSLGGGLSPISHADDAAPAISLQSRNDDELSVSKDTQSVSTMQTDKKEISEKSAESKVEVTNEEVANDKKFSINDNNVASHIYNMDATRAWMWVLRNSPKGVRAKGYGYIDKDRLGEFQDWYDIYLNSGAEEYIQALEELKNKATKKAQEYIDEVIAGVEKHRDDFRRLAEGDDSVLSTSNAAKFSISAEEQSIIDAAKANGTYMLAPNGEPSNLNEKQWAQVRTKAFKEWFGDWEKILRIEKLRGSNPIVVEFNGEYELNRDSAKQWMKDNLRGEYINADTGEKILLSKVGINEVTAHGSKDEAHLKSLSAIPSMIEGAVFIDELVNSKGHDKYDSYRYYVCGLVIDGVDYTAKIVVGVKDGSRYYDHRLTEIEKGTLLDNLNGLSNSVVDMQNTSSSVGKDTKLISILQTNSSKIVDENGEPMVVYHYTPNEFTEFDTEKIGSSTDVGAFGTGFYLSPSDGFSLYGDKKMALFVNAKNPMLLNDSNAFEAKEPFFKKDYEWTKESAQAFADDVQAKGYDAVYYENRGRDEIIAFSPSQIKSATENNGEFSGENNDIRYSISTYHGSGAKFDKFDHAFMGSGEGAQAFGWGTYVTEVEGIAKAYADSSSGNIFHSGFGDFYLRKIREGLANGETFEKVKQNLLEHHKQIYEKTGGNRELYGTFISDYEKLQSLKEEDLPVRNLYTVEIPDDNGSNYLEWDKAINENIQQRIANGLKNIGFEVEPETNHLTLSRGKNRAVLNVKAKGMDLYAELEDVLGSAKAASQFLSDLGYTGIKYPAQATTGGRADNAQNYVIFNESDAQIVDHRRFSIPTRLQQLNKAEEFIKSSILGKRRNKSFEITLPIAVLKEIKKALGRDFDSHNIDGNSFVHAKKEHGINGQKNNMSSIPLRDEDFALAPYIMVAPDLVQKGNMDAAGRESIRFIKNIDNGEVIVVEKEQKNSPDDMDTITMWADLSSNVLDARQRRPLSTTSETVVISSDYVAKIRKDAEEAIRADVEYLQKQANAKSGEQKYSIYGGNKGYVGYSMSKRAVNADIRYSMPADILAANERFNEELDEYIKKGTKANFIFHIGQPLGVMKIFFPELPIVMRPRVINKASNTKHDVDATSLYNLPQYIAEPIFVFQREDGAIGILTEMMDNNEKNVCVAVELNKKIQDGGTYLDVNDIRSIHGRDVKNIVLPIIHNNTLKYADKEKALDWFSSASSIYQQEITSQELSDATKIVQDFQNPPLPDDESSQNVENAKSGEQKYSLPARPAIPRRNEGESIMDYAQRVANATEAQKAWDVANKTAMDIDRQIKNSEEYRDILAQKEPQTIEEAASITLASGKLLWNDHIDGTKVSKGAKSMMGWGEGERRSFFAMFASKENGGVSVEQMGESVIEICHQYNIPVDDTDAMVGVNALLEVLQSAEKPSDITGYIEHNRIEQVRRMIEEEQELLANERNKAYMDIYGMTYDDFVEITSTIDTEDEQERIDDKNVIAWLYGQSQRQQERITNAQAELEQMRNSGVAKAQYDAAYRALEQMKAKAKQIQAKLDEVTRELSAAKGQATRQKKANMRYKEKKGQWKQVYKELRKAINGKNIRSIDKNTLNEIMRAVGSADLSGKAKLFGEAGMIEDIILGVNMRATQDRIDKLLATKTTALNDKGIATGKSVDASVQAILANVRKTLEGILHHDIENQIHDLRSQNWHIRHNAVGNLSQEQQEQIDANKAKIEELKAELSRELATNTANTEQAVNEQIDKLTEQIDMGLRTEEESAELMTTLALKRQMVAIHTSYQDTATVESLLRRKQSELRTMWVALHDGNTPQDKREEYRQKRKALQEQIAGLEAQVREGRQATLDAMQSFAYSLEEAITTGRTNLKGKVQEQLQRRKEFVAKAIHDVNASGKQMQSVNEAEKQENDKLPWYKRMFSPALRTFDYMLQKIATRTYGKDSWLYRQFMLGENGVMAAHDEYLRGMQTAARTLEDKAMEIFGKSYQDVMAESNRKKDIGIEILRDAEDYEPSYIPMKLTKGQATYIYMLWRMRDGYSKLATQGFTEEIMQRIEEYIGPDYIQWADWVQMEYLPMMREKYNARYREIYDTNMAAIDNYVPIRIHGQSIRKEVDLTDATASMPGMQKKNGALIQRTVNVNPIDISNNIFELIGQHIDEMEEFYAYAPVRRDLQYILSSPAFRNLLNTQEPGTFQSLLEAARIATKTNQQPESAASKAFNDILNKLQKGLVSGNIAYRNMTAIKQVLSAPAFIGYSQSPEYLSILAKNMLGGYLRNLPVTMSPLILGIGHWAQKMTVEETAKGMPYIDKFLGETFRWCMREFPDFRERVTRGSAGDIRLEEKGFSKLLDKYTELGMSANVFIDAVTVSVGLKSIYDYEMAKAAKRISKMAEEMQMDKQWTEEEMRKASNAAKIQATLFANQTQQSSNPALLSPMQVSKNFMERSLTLYKNSSLGLMRAGIGGMRNLLRFMKGKKARRRMIEEYTRMFMQEGFAENEAKKRAISYLNSEARKGAFVALLEGYVMNVIWNLGSKGLLGFMAGGDDDDKERTIGEWVWDGIKHVVKNTFGSAMPFVDDALDGRLPVIGLTTSEAEKAWKDIKKQLDENGISLALVLTGMRYAAKFGGVDMQVWANTMDGYYRLFSETGNSDDNILALMLILNSPHSNRMAVARELYKGKSEEEFQRAIELAGRYNQPVWTFGREMTNKVESDMAAWYLSDNATDEEKQRMRYIEEMEEHIDNLETVEDALKMFDEVSDTELRKKISNKIDQLGKPKDTFAEKVDRKKENALAEDDADMSGYTYMKMADSQDLLDEKRLRAEIDMLSAVVERQEELFEKHGSESEIYTTYMAEHGVEIRRYHTLQAYHRAIQTRKRKMDEEGADVNALYEKIKELYSDARNM